MNIRDALRGGYQPDKLRQANPREANKVDPGASDRSANPLDAARADVHAARDRVEISDSARAAVSGTHERDDVAFARKALLSIPPLSQDRLDDILQRIQKGYYSQPDILDLVSERLVEQLVRGPVE